MCRVVFYGWGWWFLIFTVYLAIKALWKYIFVHLVLFFNISSHQQNIQQNYNIKTANKSFVNGANFSYLEVTVSDQSCSHEEIKSIWNLRNAYYPSVQNLLSSNLLYKHTKIKICRTITLPVVLCGSEVWVSHIRGRIYTESDTEHDSMEDIWA
jgi:hypothetical protein